MPNNLFAKYKKEMKDLKTMQFEMCVSSLGIDNQAVVYIVRAMVTASNEMIPGLRLLKDLMEDRGVKI